MFTAYAFVNALLFLTLLVFLVHKYFSRNYDYWQKRKINYLKPSPIFGNFLDVLLFRCNLGEYLAKLYVQIDAPYFGMFVFDKPHLIIKDPELIKTILVRDFNYFDNRNIAQGAHDQITANMLFVNKNPDWKVTRAKMTPTFTSGKLKNMVALMNEAGEKMRDYINKHADSGPLEAKEVCAKFSTDVITICAFGIKANSFENENAVFRQVGREIFGFSYSNAIQQTAYFFLPGLVNLFKFRVVNKKTTDFLREAFWATIKTREENRHVTGKPNDMIEAIVDLRYDEKFNQAVKFEGDKVVAQAVQFFVAGFETTSSVISFTLYELCLQPKLQTRLRNEITESYKRNGGFTYESIPQMKYLDMVISETIRKYPALPFIDRCCNADYKIPDTDTVIEKGTPVYIPMIGLHYDEKYFPEPHKFDPERFSDKNIDKIVPFSYIPFGKGPRNCIGERFGLLGAKLGVCNVLYNFELEKAANTPDPLRFDPKSFLLAPLNGLPIRFKKVQAK